MNSLAFVEEQLDDLDSAFEHYKRVSGLSEIFHDKKIQWNNAQLGISRILLKRNKLTEAKEILKNSLFDCENKKLPNYNMAIELLYTVTCKILGNRYKNEK